MKRSQRARRRRRAFLFASAVAVLALGAGAGARAGRTARGPALVPNNGGATVVISPAGSTVRIRTAHAPYTLLGDSSSPPRGARVLWYRGQPTQPTPEGSVVVDSLGRLLVFRATERARDVRAAGIQIVAAAAGPHGFFRVIDALGHLRTIAADGRAGEPTATPFAYPSLAAEAEAREAWAVRSTRGYAMAPPTGPEPVIARVVAPPGVASRSIGLARVPHHVVLADLDNAGHLAAGDGRLYYAPFIRDEIIAFTSAGDTLWIAERGLPQSTPEPRFEVTAGGAVIDYRPVNLGIALGPDGRLYVLSVPGYTVSRTRLDVLDPWSGQLLWTAALDTPSPTLAVDHRGRLYFLNPDRLSPPDAAEPQPGPDFRLPMLAGGAISSTELKGRVVLLNVWVRWCTPCREELPALRDLERRVAHPGFELLAVSEDSDPGAAARFLDAQGLNLKVALGRGRQRSVFGYLGLPYSLLLDRQGRVVHRWIGYAGDGQILEMERLIRAELAAADPAPRPASDEHRHSHGGAP